MPDGDDERYDRRVMSRPHPIPAGDYVPTADQRITLCNVPWTHFEVQLALEGDDPVPRVAYLDGVLELSRPSKGHERTKSYLGRLIEVFAVERDITLSPYGGWLLKYADLAIEVIWTSGTLDKLEIYRRLEVGEVWVWKDGVLSVHVLEQGRYESARTSRVSRGLDLSLLCSFLDRPTATDAMRAFRDALRAATP